MSTSKRIDKICIAVIIITLVITVLFMNGEKLGIKINKSSLGYESRIFDTTKVHEIDIVMDDWDEFIENCESEEYSNCTVVIDGEKYKNIGIRAKGNTSLSQVKQMDSERYSFKLEFDQYDDSKSYYGLDKLCLNNLIQDNTMMKDYLVYNMMNEFGVDSPLCSYVYITVNNEDWGLYLAVEGVEDSFLTRNYDSEGELYKPDSQSNGGGRGNGKDFDMDDRMAEIEEENGTTNSESTTENTPDTLSNTSGVTVTKTATENGNQTENGTMKQMPGNNSSNGSMPQMPNSGQNGTMVTPDGNGTMPQMPGDGTMATPDGNSDSTTDETDGTQSGGKTFDFSNIFGGQGGNAGGGMGGNSSDDVKLQYIDDNADSYSNIFDNAKTDITDADKARLISSLKSLSEYSDLENILDTDEVLRYFVVHNFVCNGDSYTGSMIHNYYLYENDGKLSMIPWDYNLAFGTFQGNNASSTINTSIDSPVSSGSVDDRPMVGWIFSSEEYTNEYHELFADFIQNFIENGKMEEMITSTAEMISDYVEKDPTKFCTFEDFQSGVETIKKYMSLRGEAVSRQLQGNTEAVDTSGLDLSLMGTMNSTMGGGNDKMNFGGKTNENSDGNSDNGGTMGTPPTQNGDNTDGTQATPSTDGNGFNGGTMGTPPTQNGDNTDGTQATPSTDGNGFNGGTMGTPPTQNGDNTSGTQATPSTDGNGADGTQVTPPTMPDGNSSGQGNFNPFDNDSQNSENTDKTKDGNTVPSGQTTSTATVETVLIVSAISFVILLAGLVFAIKKKY